MDRRKLALKHADNRARKELLNDFILEDVHQYRVDRHTFTVYVGGDPYSEVEDKGMGEPGVDYNMADRFEMNLSILAGISKTRPILVNLASCGGSWEEGMKMFSAILACPNPVTVLGTKWCRSMTSLVPLAADNFVIRPPAKYMIHYGTYGFEGLAQEAYTANDELLRSREIMLRLYAARLRAQGKLAGKSERAIRLYLEERIEKAIDVWLDTDEAVNLGFADGVYEGDVQRLRRPSINWERRKAMWEVLRRPVKVTTRIE